MQNRGDLMIRSIRQEDFYEVENLAKKAFWNLNMPGCDEHYLTHLIWSQEEYLPEISLLAEENGNIVGAILYLKAKIKTDVGEQDTLIFGPLCVDPEHQKQGIGGALLAESMSLAREAGYNSIFITGDPAYYPKFGFKTADCYGVSMPDGTNFDAFMGIELTDGALKGMKGRFFYPGVYECDIHNAEYMSRVEVFDKQFPYLEKKVLPGQWR